MKLLTATDASHRDQDEDFDFGTIPGELLEPVSVCDRDRILRWPGACGCGRAFVGMSSHNTTTTAIVADVELTVDQLTAIVADIHRDDIGNDDDDGPVDAFGMAVELTEYGHAHDLGTVVRIWLYETRS